MFGNKTEYIVYNSPLFVNIFAISSPEHAIVTTFFRRPSVRRQLLPRQLFLLNNCMHFSQKCSSQDLLVKVFEKFLKSASLHNMVIREKTEKPPSYE